MHGLYPNQRLEEARERFRIVAPAIPAPHRGSRNLAARFNALPPNLRGQAVADAQTRLEERFREIFQRRHDCIHNCDRPRVKPQPLTAPDVVRRVLDDIEFLVRRCDEHINLEFRQFLVGTGCPAAVIGQIGY
jgi:hypothetical protein